MITYLLKIIICSLLFIVVYKAILEKERMFKFNRVYLLITLVLAIAIPFMTIEKTVLVNDVSIPTKIDTPEEAKVSFQQTQYLPNYTLMFWAIYFLIAIVMLARVVRNIYSILRTASTNETLEYNDYNLVFLKNECTPHSFLKYIFVNKRDFPLNTVILTHEVSHLQQRHSYDIIFLEIVRALFWFNPVLYLYRKAILLNHEFLADEEVLKHSEITTYQTLLLNTITQSAAFPAFSNSINYSLTKKRFIMMSKRISNRTFAAKTILVALSISLITFVFINRSVTQISVSEEKPKVTAEISEAELKEYHSLVSSKRKKKGNTYYWENFTKEEEAYLKTLFFKMTPQQQKSQLLVFEKHSTFLAKETPKQTEFEQWKNGKIYGVWLDGKRIQNSSLNKYKNTDFSHSSISKLHKNAVNYGNHYYQVDLMTNQYYVSYLEDIKKKENEFYMIPNFALLSKATNTVAPK